MNNEKIIGRIMECKTLHTYSDKFNAINNQFYLACERGDENTEIRSFVEYLKTSSHRKKVTNKER